MSRSSSTRRTRRITHIKLISEAMNFKIFFQCRSVCLCKVFGFFFHKPPFSRSRAKEFVRHRRHEEKLEKADDLIVNHRSTGSSFAVLHLPVEARCSPNRPAGPRLSLLCAQVLPSLCLPALRVGLLDPQWAVDPLPRVRDRFETCSKRSCRKK